MYNSCTTCDNGNMSNCSTTWNNGNMSNCCTTWNNGNMSNTCCTCDSCDTDNTSNTKRKGKSSTPKTPSVVTPNPNDYGPLVPDAIEKALLESEAPNIVMYNNRIQGCYYKKRRHKWDSMFMIPPNNMLFRMKTYREYTRKADGV